ncbi:MAG: hypothetical protein ACTTKL_03365 [Treponema sp.]
MIRNIRLTDAKAVRDISEYALGYKTAGGRGRSVNDLPDHRLPTFCLRAKRA